MQNKINQIRQKYKEMMLKLHPSSNIISIYFLSPVASQIESVDLYIFSYQKIKFRQFCDFHFLNTSNYAHHDAFCLVSNLS